MAWDGREVQRVAGPGGVDVRAVRALVGDALAKGPPQVDVGDVDVITSEIATNARRYSASGRPGGGVWVVVLYAERRLRVEIQDDGGRRDGADDLGRGR
ncbi:ATP-binding protein [Actinomadura viridis]|uniref:ATP-binding protein n=1 Tax=Actinomadura viridis TaxID=58110 RepID=UPI0036AB8021